LLKEPEPVMVLRPWHCWENENRRLFEKSKNRPTPVHSHPACLLLEEMALVLREKERKERLGNFFVGPDQNCKRMWVWGLRERGMGFCIHTWQQKSKVTLEPHLALCGVKPSMHLWSSHGFLIVSQAPASQSSGFSSSSPTMLLITILHTSPYPPHLPNQLYNFF
jgi:hypothetical protein